MFNYLNPLLLARGFSSLLAFALLLISGAAQAGNTVVVFPNYIVTTPGDDGTATSCTLRQAVQNANNLARGRGISASSCADQNNPVSNTGPSVIRFDPGIRNAGSTPAIVLTQGELAISTAMTITGPGSGLLSISGNNASRILSGSNRSITLTGLTITGGSVTGDNGGAINFAGGDSSLNLTDVIVTGNRVVGTSDSISFCLGCQPTTIFRPGSGGGIYINSARLVLTNSTVSDNSAEEGTGGANSGLGGAIRAQGSNSVVIKNSTISGNTASRGGGIFTSTSPVAINNSTLSGNTASGNDGHAVYVVSNTVSLSNSTLAGNGASSGNTLFVDSVSGASAIASNSIIAAVQPVLACGSSGSPPVASGSSNNFATDASCGVSPSVTNTAMLNLGALADNGGPTKTIALGTDSVALGAGDSTVCNSTAVGNVDQRGVTRTIMNTKVVCSVGAFDPPPTFMSAGATPMTVGISSGAGTINSVSSSAALPAGFTGPVPASVFTFNVANLTTDTVDVTLTLPVGSAPLGYIKCPAVVGACILLPTTGGVGVTPPSVAIVGNVITLTLKDGDIYDTDAAVGAIGDPGGPFFGGGGGGTHDDGFLGLGALNLFGVFTLGLFGLINATRRKRIA